MKNNIADQYIRIGTKYYKRTEMPLASNDSISVLLNWDKETIKFDYGDKILRQVKNFDGFCLIPSHTNYQQIHGNFYNKYEDIGYNPINGECHRTLQFLDHIFGEHFHLGLEYLKVLFENPRQILPILCLVSKERETGKTTFLNWLKAIFKGNMTINTNEDFRSRFNSDWSSKLIIAVDETLLDKKEDSERLKTLSTSRVNKTEAKGKDKVEHEFFGKFILCANPKDNEPFIKLDSEEIRYWIVTVPRLQVRVPGLLDEMIKEIPAFLNYLIHLPIKHKDKNSRMWFSAKSISTDALQQLKKQNRPLLEAEITEVIKDKLLDHNLKEVCYTRQDLQDILKHKGFKVTITQMNNILKRKWDMDPEKNSKAYKRYFFEKSGSETQTVFHMEKGRYYTFKSEDFLTSEELNYSKS
ncbi:MAG: helicase [Thalassobius sp.]|nr:helicase [Thalassovita sp.]